jgi:RNase P subunit RPR2
MSDPIIEEHRKPYYVDGDTYLLQLDCARCKFKLWKEVKISVRNDGSIFYPVGKLCPDCGFDLRIQEKLTLST